MIIATVSGSLKGYQMVKNQGFTLSELMIVIAVLAILAAIAVPSFSAFSKKGHLNKAKAALMENAHFMEQHYAQHKTFKKTQPLGLIYPLLPQANLILPLQAKPEVLMNMTAIFCVPHPTRHTPK